jgi:hypothetical protein
MKNAEPMVQPRELLIVSIFWMRQAACLAMEYEDRDVNV